MSPLKESYDLIVVGTGFASTFFLKKYLEKTRQSQGKILVLERGYNYPHRDRVKELRGELPDVANKNPNHGSTFINKNEDKHWPFSIGFGGSSNCWYACTPRFMPSDFKMKTLYGIAEDWPVQYEELEPYYTEVEDAMEISGPDETPFPKSKQYPLRAHQFNSVDKLLHAKYGSQYISQPTARASQATANRNACCVSAVCGICPVNAKFTIENSGFNVYDDKRVTLQFGAQVRHVVLQGDVAKGVVYTSDNKDTEVSGDVVALGTNALFNANILLQSGDDHPLTGRGLGEQLGLDALVYLDNLDNVGGSTWVTANGYMLYDGDHRKDYAACIMESNNAPYVRLESRKWRHIATFRMIFEDLPNNDNRVQRGQDPLVPEVHYGKPSEYTMRAVKNMKEKLPGLFSCLPVEDIKFMEPYKTEAHILGTTRMHDSKEKGVIDKHLIHHRYRNLFVLGSGSFTTFTPNNPTLTLSALSLLAADKSF